MPRRGAAGAAVGVPLAALRGRTARVYAQPPRADPGLGGAVPAGLRRLPAGAPAQPRPVAALARRRKDAGNRLSQCHRQERDHAAL